MYKLMIVDDENNIRNGMAHGIPWNEWGFEVAALAEDGVEALELVEKVKPDVVISDIKMPRMDGAELMQRLHELHPEIKVIIVSGYNDFEYMNTAIKNDVVEYLMKPTDIDEFRETFERIKEKIDEEREISDEFEKSKIYYLNHILNTLLLGYMDDEISDSDRRIVERFNICTDNCAIAVVDVDWPEFPQEERERYKKHRELTGVCNECAEEMGVGCYFFLSNDNKLTAILSDAEEDLTNDVCVSVFNDIAEEIYNKIGERTYISLGSISVDRRMIAQSYEQAVCTAHYRRFCEDKSVMQYTELDDAPAEYRSVKFDCNLISECIMKNDMGSIREEIERVVSFFEENKISDYQYVERIFMELIFYLSRWSLSYNISLEETMELEGIKYNDIRRIVGIERKKGLVISVISALCESVERVVHNTGVNSSLTRVIKNCVDSEYMENYMSLDYVAGKVNKSATYVSKIFKEKFGCGFGEYVTRRRLEASKNLLADPTKKIYEIAAMSGYADVSNFIKVFKKVYGISPGSYRKFIQE